MTERDKERAQRAGDPEVSAAYRELGAQEPPRELDDAILAAARREAGTRPASLASPVVRGGRQRWYAPLAAAAVLVLAVAVTLNMQLERPGIESPAPQGVPPVAVKETAKEVVKPVAADEVVKAAPDRAKPKAEVPAKPAEPRTFAPDPVPPAAPPPAPAPQAQARVQVPGPAAGASGASAEAARERDERADLARERVRPFAASEATAKRAEAPARTLAETPERELERIAELRAQGRHDEADRALAEFRKRYPEFRIPEEMRARVERR